jgi:aspartokinase
VEKVKIGGILKSKGLASIEVIGIPDRPGVASLIFGILGRSGINVEFIVHARDQDKHSHVTFCVDRKDMFEAVSLLDQRHDEIGCTDILHNQDVGLISIFGPHFRERPGIAAQFFKALGSSRINILAISTSISTCSCLIDEGDMPAAVSALSQTFELPGS